MKNECLFDHNDAHDMDGKEVKLKDLCKDAKAILVINVACQCLHAKKHYEGLI